MLAPLIRRVGCISLPVANLDEALAFYRDQLGHSLVWRTASASGLRPAQRLVTANLAIPPLKFKFAVRNGSGVSFPASGCALNSRRHSEQGV
jgi:catechol 2,3-dioxygenase-like lactoylglutathione lyase family enzyme